MPLSKQNIKKTDNPQGPASIHPRPPATFLKPVTKVIKVPGNAKRP